MALSYSFSFRNGMDGAPKEMEKKLMRAAYATVRYHEGRAEAHMKQKAPWRDRTTNARNGLFAKAAKVGKATFALILAHSVTYGIYLERGTRKMRARPIIIPTLELYGPKVMQTFTKILNRL